MKKLLPLALLATVVLTIFSCKKADVKTGAPELQATPQYVQDSYNSSPGVRRVGDEECAPTVVDLMAGQTMNAGSITVTNDSAFIYVTYATTGSWVITETHLYVGDCALIPVNNPGNPIPGQFPYSSSHSNITTYTYQVPISKIPAGTCGCIAAHCVVKQLNSSGGTIQTQTGWGNGVRINLSGGNWGMKFDYCSCTPTP